MGDDQFAVVEDVVAHQAVEELADRLPELSGLTVELGDGVSQAVRDLDVAPLELAHQLHVVVARRAEGVSGLDHAHDEPQDIGDLRPAVDDVAEEDGLASLGMASADLVAESRQQLDQFVVAAVDVTDDIERPVLVPLVVVERVADDLRRIDLLRRTEDVDMPEALARQAADRAPKLPALLPNDVRAEIPVRALPITFLAELLRQVEHDGDGQTVEAPRQLDERLPSLGLDVRRVDDGQLPGRKPLGRDEVQYLEGILRGRLVVLVVGHKRPAEVG